MVIANSNPLLRSMFVCIGFVTLCAFKPLDPNRSGEKDNAPSQLQAAAIGVADLGTAVTFYLTAISLQEVSRTRFRDRTEVRLSAHNGQGSDLILMGYHDRRTRDFANNPGKLVFYSEDVLSLANNVYFSGGQILLPPTPQPQFGGALVGFARDLDGNLLEMVGVPSTEGTYMSAFGIGVSDLESTKTLYTQVFGFKVQTYLEIPGQYNEYILESGSPDASALVLMHWTNGSERSYTNNPLLLEIATPNLWSIRWSAWQYGLKTQPLKPVGSHPYPGLLITDPDGIPIKVYGALELGNFKLGNFKLGISH